MFCFGFLFCFLFVLFFCFVFCLFSCFGFLGLVVGLGVLGVFWCVLFFGVFCSECSPAHPILWMILWVRWMGEEGSGLL